MITDPEKNFLYLSDLLADEPEYRNFWQRLKKILERERMLYALLSNTKDL